MVGLTAALLLVTALGVPGWALPRETTCQVGSEVGEFTIWTPSGIVNKPLDSSVNLFGDTWSYGFNSGSLTLISPTNPGSAGIGDSNPTAGILASYAEFNWVFYRTTNVSTVDANGQPCTQPYVAQVQLPALTQVEICLIPIMNNLSDVHQPHSFNGTEGTPGCFVQPSDDYVSFFTAFPTSNGTPIVGATLDLCGQSQPYPLPLTGLAELPISITVHLSGGNLTASGVLSWTGGPQPADPYFVSAYYDLAPGWSWQLASIAAEENPFSPAMPLPGLLAFIQTPC